MAAGLMTSRDVRSGADEFLKWSLRLAKRPERRSTIVWPVFQAAHTNGWLN